MSPSQAGGAPVQIVDVEEAGLRGQSIEEGIAVGAPFHGQDLAGLVLDDELLGRQLLEPVVQPDLERMPEDAAHHDKWPRPGWPGRSCHRSRTPPPRPPIAAMVHLGILGRRNLTLHQVIVGPGAGVQGHDAVIVKAQLEIDLLDEQTIADGPSIEFLAVGRGQREAGACAADRIPPRSGYSPLVPRGT